MRFAFVSAIGCGVAIACVYACGGDGDGFVPGSPDQDDAAPYDAGYVFSEASSPSDGPVDNTQYPPSSVALGEGFACVVAADHSVWCWGQNDVGQLGSDPAKSPSTCGTAAVPCNPTPTQVQGLPPVLNVAAGKDFACALAAGANVWCWGGNAMNQLLVDAVTSRFTPQITANDAVEVMAAGQHACILASEGFLHCWGDNPCNLFGRVDEAGISGATTITGLPPMKQASLGVDQMCAVSPDDATYCWGSDHSGSLGHDVSSAPMCNGHPFDGVPKRVAMPGGLVTFDGGIEVHVGDGLACARKTDDSVWCWGDNSRGGLGQGAPDNDVHMFPAAVPAVETTELAVAGQTACVIEAQRPLCWGDAQYGQMDSLGTDAGCGGTGCRPVGYVIPGQEPARDVFVGPDAIATIKTDLSLWAWGRNDFGEAATLPTDSSNESCAGTSVCIPDPRQVTTAPPLF